MNRPAPELPADIVRAIVSQALAEDLGPGDATSLAVVPAARCIRASLRSRQPCVVAGLPVAAAVFSALDDRVRLVDAVAEGTELPAGGLLAHVEGPARPILSGERCALNFLQRLCAIATVARAAVRALGDGPTRLLDTRKTTPGLRHLEKYAVRVGGAENHRMGLYDRIMIKDNHRQLAAMDGPGGIARAVAACRQLYPALEVEVEVDTFAELDEALATDADYILLDNMSDAQLAAAVARRDAAGSRARLEASGGITAERLRRIAATGVDFVSSGALTYAAGAIDIGMDIDGEG